VGFSPSTSGAKHIMHAQIKGIEYYLPPTTVTTDQLAAEFPEWRVGQIDTKTGIRERHIADENECASDLGFAAAVRLFEAGVCRPQDVDYLLLCSQSPDYVLPTTACLLQNRLGIPKSAGALDFNLGCSGFVYGLGLAEGLIASGQASSILLITAETYSKYIRKDDKNCRTIFGDGAAATFIVSEAANVASIGPFVYGTDGGGGCHLMVPDSGVRKSDPGRAQDRARSDPALVMHGVQVFEFCISAVPMAVNALLKKARLSMEDVDLFVFHQANAYILETMRADLGIPRDKFQITISHCANTVSSTIPIALKHAEGEGRLEGGSRVMLVGFGVGYSWGAALIRWNPLSS
jgi:3-oxoacyl-[acyl-carrier-protein] synthase-3